MEKTHRVLILASFIASALLIADAVLLVCMIALAPHLSGVDALFKAACLFLKYSFPIGLLLAFPAFALALFLRTRIIRSVVAVLLGALVVGAWWIVGNIPVGF